MLTLNDIYNLHQDRYTDGLIARFLFGEGEWTKGDGEENRKAVPYFSTNMIDAYKIVQRLTALGYIVRITEGFYNSKVEVIGNEKQAFFVDKNTELTICKAALYFLIGGGHHTSIKH